MSAYWHQLVGGAFDRSDRHRPQDRTTLRAAAQELEARGLTPRDIAAALKLSEGAVSELLATQGSVGTETGATSEPVFRPS